MNGTLQEAVKRCLDPQINRLQKVKDFLDSDRFYDIYEKLALTFGFVMIGLFLAVAFYYK